MRAEGRGYQNLREVKIARNYIKYAEGSCLMEMGDTKVICTASVEDKVPQFLQGKGCGWVTAEYGMLPRSCERRIHREGGKGKGMGRAYEIQRLIGRSLRAVVLLPALGERTIWIDCDVIQADGGTRCAAITGAFIALVDALAKLKKGKVITKLPVKDFVAATSVGVLEGKPVLDLTYEEDSKAWVDMNVVMTGSGRFIEVQGTAETEPFSKADMDKLLDLARNGIEQLIGIQKKALKIKSF